MSMTRRRSATSQAACSNITVLERKIEHAGGDEGSARTVEHGDRNLERFYGISPSETGPA